jgi:hypothetical protein
LGPSASARSARRRAGIGRGGGAADCQLVRQGEPRAFDVSSAARRAPGFARHSLEQLDKYAGVGSRLRAPKEGAVSTRSATASNKEPEMHAHRDHVLGIRVSNEELAVLTRAAEQEMSQLVRRAALREEQARAAARDAKAARPIHLETFCLKGWALTPSILSDRRPPPRPFRHCRASGIVQSTFQQPASAAARPVASRPAQCAEHPARGHSSGHPQATIHAPARASAGV